MHSSPRRKYGENWYGHIQQMGWRAEKQERRSTEGEGVRNQQEGRGEEEEREGEKGEERERERL